MFASVALRKESVDRNDKSKRLKTEKRKSLSARRAWIEMVLGLSWCIRSFVALRKESVDRNYSQPKGEGLTTKVALRKESVDRNLLMMAVFLK